MILPHKISLVGAVLFAYLLGSSVTYGQDRISAQNFLLKFSLSTEPIDVQIGSTHWQIPRNYFRSVAFQRDTGWAGFSIGVIFPDFSGATENSFPCFIGNIVGCTSLIRLHRLPSGKRPVYLYNILMKALPTRDHEQVFGLTKIMGSSIKGPIPGEFYIRPGNGPEDTILISCTPPQGPAHKCQEIIRLSAEVLVTVNYKPERLPDWRAIHDGIIRLFEGFMARGGI